MGRGESSMPVHIVFSCGCGRDLRARADLAGTTVRCWSCQAEVPVPTAKPDSGRALELFVGLRDVFRAEFLLAIPLGALLVSCTLLLPVVGAPVGLALLAAAAMLYREVIRVSGLQGAPGTPEPAWRVWPVRIAWGLLIALGLTAPVLLRHGIMDGYRQLIPLRGAGVAAAAVLGWIVVPLITLIGSACDRSGALSVRAAQRVVGRHPIVTLAGLLIVPAGLLFLETALATITSQQGWFGYMILDLFPRRDADWLPRHPMYPLDIQFPEHAHLSEFFRHYSHGLRLGYTLIGAIPASLPRFPNMRISPWFPLAYDWIYIAAKVLISTLTLAVFAFLLAIQARWLGLIPTLDAGRDTAAARPNL